MDTHHPLHPHLSELPLWRLLVALADAERAAGPDSATARALARAVQERLHGPSSHPPTDTETEGTRCRD
jgi:hypothetical protein